MSRLEWLSVSGYKTIRHLELQLHNLNVLIGANGSGKSNLISLFRLMAAQFASPSGNLQQYVGLQGGANALLHDGSKVTREIEIDLKFKTTQGYSDYTCHLSHAAGDTFVFMDESYLLINHQCSTLNEKMITGIGHGHRESKLIELAETPSGQAAKDVLETLRKIKVYQFQDTSFNSRIRGKWNVTDYFELKEDGANLASFLMHLRDSDPPYYRVVFDTIRMIAPFLEDFVFNEEYGAVLLRWREKGSDLIFDASQASDGMLRAMALVTLLSQPPSILPDVLIIDEPELGLHPFAISVIAGMIRNVARHTQVIIATQSAAFIDEFEPEDIIIVERSGRDTTCKRLDAKDLDGWLRRYSLSELWEKNVIGGRP